MRTMETIQDLIEEAKVRTVWWGLLVFAVTYFITNTSKSMWMNIPIAILLVATLRIILNKVDFRWKPKPERRPQTYLSHLEKKQLALEDPIVSTARPPSKWKRKIDSPVVEAAVDEFISKILQDFVIDLWYSEITPDREAPELIRDLIMDALAEISGRLKQLNLVDLMTRDIVDLVGDHIDQFRRTQAAIGVDVMGILSCEERDERLKHQLMTSNELHPALISAESEYKVLQRLIGGILAVVLRPREAQCPLVRCIAREFVTCLVVQPVLDFASPEFINELIEVVILALKEDWGADALGGMVKGTDSVKGEKKSELSAQKSWPSNNADSTTTISKVDKHVKYSSAGDPYSNVVLQSPPIGWAHGLEAATQRRTEVLMPENLENMWSKGRHYDRKIQKIAKAGAQESLIDISAAKIDVSKEKLGSHLHDRLNYEVSERLEILGDLSKRRAFEEAHIGDKLEQRELYVAKEKTGLKRSNSTSALDEKFDQFAREGGGLLISENFYGPNLVRGNEAKKLMSASDIVIHNDRPHPTRLRCRVIGAFFEKSGSKSFAVYSVAVTDAENATWFVKRRYRNFERLHRHLKDIPNYTLHLPPKRIFSSSTEDAFVHQRCIQLDKYLQDLLSIANVAEQHEVWDFLSASSKNYSFGKSSSVMRTLAVNVDDAMDDIVRQFKGASDGLMSKIAGSPQPSHQSPSVPGRNLSWHSELDKHVTKHDLAGSTNSFSDNEEDDHVAHDHGEEESTSHANGWHSDNELNSKSFPPRVVRRYEHERPERSLAISFSADSRQCEDPHGMPAGWAPPNVTVPVLNLVDKIFQLKKRGWLRRQVFWMSKQILQLMMEDAVDDWLLRQVHWLRREDVIAKGIRWVQDVLWPGGTFFKKISVFATQAEDGNSDKKSVQTPRLSGSKSSNTESFDQHLEAARRANEVKKLLFDGAPSTLVSLIGPKQYKRCARDIYYFSQSKICIKQLTFGGLELLIISVFPELRDLVLDIHKQNRGKIVA
uniref:Uncharacterized protein n=1 Tax=Kalanchoe fedtschenkoi TaxID=63787 RepID=A0A7N0VHE0_KALFE